MSIRFDASSDELFRVNGLPGAPFTMMCWVYISTVRVANTGLLSYSDSSPGTSDKALRTSSDGVTLVYWDGTTANATGVVLTASVWYHLAFSFDTTSGAKVYVNGVQVFSGGSTTFAPGTPNMFLGRTVSSEWLNGRLGAAKVFSAVLTPDEISQEMLTYVPLKTTSVNSWAPLFISTDLKDFSGLGPSYVGNHWSSLGALTSEDNPPIVWKLPNKRNWFIFGTVDGTATMGSTDVSIGSTAVAGSGSANASVASVSVALASVSVSGSGDASVSLSNASVVIDSPALNPSANASGAMSSQTVLVDGYALTGAGGASGALNSTGIVYGSPSLSGSGSANTSITSGHVLISSYPIRIPAALLVRLAARFGIHFGIRF